MGLGAGESVVVAFAAVLGVVAVAVPAGIICRRVGFAWWLGALAVVPVANAILLWYVALAPWPAEGTRMRTADAVPPIQ